MSADGSAQPRPPSFGDIPNNTRASLTFDGAAAVASGASAVLSGTAQNMVAVGSGALWAASGVASQVGTRPAVNLDTTINAAATLAGAANVASALTSQFADSATGAKVDYGSSASWALGGFVSMAKGARDFYNATDRRQKIHAGLTGLSGALNVAASGFAISSAHASAENDTATAQTHGLASSALWVGGTAAALGAAYFAPPPRRANAPASVSDIESGHPPSPDIHTPLLHSPSIQNARRDSVARDDRTIPASQTPPRALSPQPHHDSARPVLPSVPDPVVTSSAALRPDLPSPSPHVAVPILPPVGTPPQHHASMPQALSPRAATPPRRNSLGPATPPTGSPLSPMPNASPARSRSSSTSSVASKTGAV